MWKLGEAEADTQGGRWEVDSWRVSRHPGNDVPNQRFAFMHRRLVRPIRAVLVVGLLASALIAPSGAALAGTPKSETPVMSSATLTEAQVLAWFRSATRQPFNATVSDTELVRLYREEGRRLGIRWDVAFTQGIIETAWFSWPDYGMVRASANNFAGMGAFDGSSGGFVFQFPDARTGIRAQMQHLRLYSDPTTNLEGTNLGAPLAQDIENRYPTRWRTLRASKLADGQYAYAGRVPMWEGFGGGMWATDPLYACKVMNLYRQARVFNGQSAGDLPTNGACLRTWHLRNENSVGNADTLAFLGRAGDEVLACDWNGNGRDTPGTFRDGSWTISNQTNGGGPLTTFAYGRAGDLPLCGDWNGNGKDTVGIVRDREWHLKNDLSTGHADVSFVYGRVTRGDKPIVGNWNGGAGDGIGIIRDGQWHLRNTLSAGSGEIVFTYGRLTRGDLPLIGDWNGTGHDGVGIVRDGQWHLRNTLSAGNGEIVFTYGRVTSGDVPLVGDWTGDGKSTPAIVRS
jgi:hypothetical protein